MEETKEKHIHWSESFSNILFSVSFCIISTVCLIGLIGCISGFLNNEKSFNSAYLQASNQLTINAENNKVSQDEIKEKIEYIERLQSVHKSSTTNDVLSFIYGMLSTIMVGLCAGFVVKSKKGADESKESAIIVKDMLKSTKTAQKTVESIQNNLLNTMSEMIMQQNTILENSKEIDKKMNKTAEQLDSYSETFRVLEIHIYIMLAKNSLYSMDQININAYFYDIAKLTKKLSKKCDKLLLNQLRDEMLKLKSAIDDSISTQIDTIPDIKKKTSSMQTINRVTNQIDESISVCDKILT